MGYADMHCHIMPGVDDGSYDMEMTRNMTDIAYDEGIDTMILTPHYKPGHTHVSPDEIRAFAREMTAECEARGKRITFYTGNEILYFTDCTDRLDRGLICTLADSRYVLVEFEPMDDVERIVGGIRNLMYAGYNPVLAHAERYACMLRNKTNIRRVLDMGSLVQVNASSITGDFGHDAKVFTHDLLKEKGVHFVATDAHSDRRRAPRLKKCAKILNRKCGEAYAEKLLGLNARRIIAGEDIT